MDHSGPCWVQAIAVPVHHHRQELVRVQRQVFHLPHSLLAQWPLSPPLVAKRRRISASFRTSWSGGRRVYLPHQCHPAQKRRLVRVRRPHGRDHRDHRMWTSRSVGAPHKLCPPQRCARLDNIGGHQFLGQAPQLMDQVAQVFDQWRQIISRSLKVAFVNLSSHIHH